MPGRKNQFLSAKEKAEVFSILSVIIKTGVSIQSALAGQIEESRNPAQRRLYRRIILATDKGKDISVALDGIEGFSKIDVSLVRAAEKTGNLPEILSNLGSFYKKSDLFRSKISWALLLPACTFTAACFIAAFPALIKHGLIRFIFESFTYICGAIALFLVGYIFFRNLKNRAGTNKKASLLYYSIPIFGGIEKKLDLYNFNRIFSLSVSAGLGMAECLDTSATGVRGFAMKEDIFKIRYNVEKRGMTLNEAMMGSEALGSLAKRMLAGGEISGTLQETMAKLADYLDEEINFNIKNLIKIVSIVSTVLVSLFLIARILMLAGGIFTLKSF